MARPSAMRIKIKNAVLREKPEKSKWPFMSAVIHCLYNTKDFSDFFVNTLFPEIEHNVSIELAELFEKFWKENYLLDNYVFLEAALLETKHEDTHAGKANGFLRFLLSTLHKEIACFPKEYLIEREDLDKSYEEDWTRLRENVGDSIIHEIFSSIHKTDDKYRCYLTYVLPSCTSYVTINLFNHMNGTACTACKTSSYTRRFSKFPKVLVIDSNLREMTFAEKMYLTNIELHKSRRNPIYDLYAIVYCVKEPDRDSHYYSICKHRKNDEWYMFDGENVTPYPDFMPNPVDEFDYDVYFDPYSELPQHVTKGAILLFYRLKEVPGSRGLENVRGTCFMNAVVQCLSNTKGFSSYFLNMELPPTTRSYISKALCELFRNIWDEDSTGPFKIDDLTRALMKSDKSFYESQCWSPGSFLKYLLKMLHEELKCDRAAVCSTLLPLNVKSLQAERGHSRIYDIFGSAYKKIKIMKFLRHPIYRYSRTKLRYYADGLTFVLKRCVEDVERNLWRHMVERTCKKCKKLNEKTHRTSFAIFPKVLMIDFFHLENVSFPVKLNLNALKPPKSKQNPIYDLYALIYHFHVVSHKDAHCYAVCKNEENDEWYFCNDETVKLLPNFKPQQLSVHAETHEDRVAAVFYRIRSE